MKKLIALGLLIALLVIAAENFHPTGRAAKTDDDIVETLAQKHSLSQQVSEEETTNPQDAVEDVEPDKPESPAPQTHGSTPTPSTPSSGRGSSGSDTTTPTNPAPTQPTPPAPTPTPAPSFDAGTVISSVRSQVGGFMTYLDGASNGMGYFEFNLGTHLSQDKIIADLVSAFSGEGSRGNIYFDIAYLGAWDGNHHFQCYRAM